MEKYNPVHDLPVATLASRCYFCNYPMTSQHVYKGVILCDKHDTPEVRKIIDVQVANIR